jgi:hypothetical protein
MKQESVRKRLGRRKLKLKAIEYKGGKCQRCGYDKCFAALQFHHRNREEKSFELSLIQKTKLESVKDKLDKCDLLCANCHAEVEQEFWNYRLVTGRLIVDQRAGV